MSAPEQEKQEHPPITIHYIGHSAFTFAAGEKLIAIDPFITGNPSATIKAEDIEPTTILVTHAHDDHVGDTVKLADRTGAPVVAQVELAGFLKSKGCETITPNYGGTAQFDGGTVKFDIDPFRKHCLLNGLDGIGLTMQKGAAIDTFEKKLDERAWA